MLPPKTTGVFRSRLRIITVMEEKVQFCEVAPPSDSAEASEECEVCGGEMYGLHCKLICSNCGYRRDCSDP